ncbi:hypothetical protein ACLKA6_005245 [Drosophila palustris]
MEAIFGGDLAVSGCRTLVTLVTEEENILHNENFETEVDALLHSHCATLLQATRFHNDKPFDYPEYKSCPNDVKDPHGGTKNVGYGCDQSWRSPKLREI